MKISTSELIARGINAFKSADGSIRPSVYDPRNAELCFAAARTWANRAEYSLECDGELAESDFEQADRVMFERRLAVEKGHTMNTDKLLSPSERGKLGGRKPGCKGRTLTTEQARATVKARWDKYRATKNTTKGNQ